MIAEMVIHFFIRFFFPEYKNTICPENNPLKFI